MLRSSPHAVAPMCSSLVPPPDSLLGAPHFSLHASYTPKAVQAFLAYQKYKLGADSALFSQEYIDPTADPNAAGTIGNDYTGYSADTDPTATADPAFDGSAGYQGQEY
ncbi:hypothetical protein DPEC_G00275910 [Dallia pectoralis]|uniref:Uncharacterized protein n=1 Tax=Dallia pectoralis TaxID=75939 RepID=A0ACC2FLD8_DALPE|nr:hypothetical protein DPEC_G00275910 [Dallia pectoralis]